MIGRKIGIDVNQGEVRIFAESQIIGEFENSF